jgi:hypothetical protein
MLPGEQARGATSGGLEDDAAESELEEHERVDGLEATGSERLVGPREQCARPDGAVAVVARRDHEVVELPCRRDGVVVGDEQVSDGGIARPVAQAQSTGPGPQDVGGPADTTAAAWAPIGQERARCTHRRRR